MKEFIDKFKHFIRFITTVFASREFAFIYCLSGTGAQVTHTYFLTSAISSFTGWFQVFQASLVSFFISSSLLYFVSIADSSADEKEYRRIKIATNVFMLIEILINFYYYSRHLIIDSPKVQIFDFIFAVLVSCLIPVTIKLYANSIRAKEWIDEMTNPVPKREELEVKLVEYLDDKINNTSEILDNKLDNMRKAFIASEVEEVGNLKHLISEQKNELSEKFFQQKLDIDNFKDDTKQEVDNKLSEFSEKFKQIEDENDIRTQDFLSIKNNLANKAIEIDKSLIENIVNRYLKNVQSDKDYITFDGMKDFVNNELKKSLDGDISHIFEKNQNLFLQQFENKIRLMLDKEIKNRQ